MFLPTFLLLVSVLPFSVTTERVPPSGTIETEPTVRRADVFRTDYANTSAKEEYGDAPWVTRNGNIPLVFVVKDANEDNMCFTYLRLYRNVGAVRELVAEDATPRTISTDQTYWSLELPTSLFDLAVGDTVLFEWELQFNDAFCTRSHLNHYFIRVSIGQPLPNLAGWWRADTHYHTQYTDNVFEFGGYIPTVAKAAQSIGLHAICVTDHSTDLTPANWDSVVSKSTAASHAGFLMIPGLELTLDSNESNDLPDDRIHLLAIGLSRLLPAPEECCVTNSSSQLWTLRRGLDSVTVQNAVAMAAHPASNYSVGFGGNLAIWSATNWDVAATYTAFIGSEFFNERKVKSNNTAVTEDYIYPYGWQSNPNWETTWQGGMVQYLGRLMGSLSPLRPLALAGGSDAHGDLGYKTTNQYGTINLAANDDALGKVHSVIYAPAGLSRSNVINGIRQGAVVMSDGPIAVMTVDLDGNGSDEGTVGGQFALSSTSLLRLRGNSLNEFGNFTSLRLLRVTPAGIDTIPLAASGLSFNQTYPAYSLATPGVWTAVLLEARTANGFRSVTSPMYFAPQGTTDVPLSGDWTGMTPPWPNPCRHIVSFTISTPADADVAVSVHDVSGRLIETLRQGPLPAGRTEFRWSPVQQQPNGIYWITARIGPTRYRKKVVLLR